MGDFNGEYEFTPSRPADIITYTTWTNVLQNVQRLGDALTNSYQQSVLRPGENLTMTVSMSDPAGGLVQAAPVTAGLPAGATWVSYSNSPSAGLPATATFYFAPTVGDEGNAYTITLNETNSDGVTANTWSIYVPTADEQLIYISEFLANPTTNTSSHYFNPLQRPNGDTNKVTSWDQYVEIANLSPDNLTIGNWSIWVDGAEAFQDYNFDTLSSSNFLLIYGGGYTGDTSAPTNPQYFPADFGDSPALGLPTTGTGVIELLNGGGNIVDRVVYTASQLSTNGSLSRFPKLNSGFYPQPWISTNLATPGLQYDGGSWSLPTKVPSPVPVTKVSVGNPNPVTLSFYGITTNAATLWEGNTVSSLFQVIYGYTPLTTNGSFTITNAPSGYQFYFITHQ
jgi:hypothetical protein